MPSTTGRPGPLGAEDVAAVDGKHPLRRFPIASRQTFVAILKSQGRRASPPDPERGPARRAGASPGVRPRRRGASRASGSSARGASADAARSGSRTRLRRRSRPSRRVRLQRSSSERRRGDEFRAFAAGSSERTAIRTKGRRQKGHCTCSSRPRKAGEARDPGTLLLHPRCRHRTGHVLNGRIPPGTAYLRGVGQRSAPHNPPTRTPWPRRSTACRSSSPRRR